MNALKAALETQHGMSGHPCAEAVFDIASSHQHDEYETRSLYAEIVERIVFTKSHSRGSTKPMLDSIRKGFDEEALGLYP